MIRNQATNQFADETSDISEIRPAGQQFEIVFTRNNKHYRYHRDRVMILRNPQRRMLAEGERVEVNGSVWAHATEVLTFTGADGTWSRVFYSTRTGEKYSSYGASRVRILTSATDAPAVASVLCYWRTVVARLPRAEAQLGPPPAVWWAGTAHPRAGDGREGRSSFLTKK